MRCLGKPHGGRPAVRTGALVLLFLLGLCCQSSEAQTVADLPERPLRTDGRVEFLRAGGSVAASVEVEIAETAADRARGLMGRRSLDFSQGMLFVFRSPETPRFWMRNTPISLDIIFIGEDGRVLNMIERAPPMSDRVFEPAGRAQYVVEVKGGFVRRYGIEGNTRIRWRRLGK